MEPIIEFIIPIRHPENMRDVQEGISILRQTINSARNQTVNKFKITIVANRMDEINSLSDICDIIWVDIPKNNFHEKEGCNKNDYYSAVRKDKSDRIFEALKVSRAKFVIFLDDDDFVHKGICEHCSNNANETGWYVDSGYTWRQDSKFLLPRFSDFYKLCGTCYVVNRERLLEVIYKSDDLSSAKSMLLGSHIYLKDCMEESGLPLKPFKFKAVVYRHSHANTHSRSKHQGALRFFLSALEDLIRLNFASAIRKVGGFSTYKKSQKDFGLP